MSVNDIAGHPGNWPATSRKDPRAPVGVTGIMLRGDGEDIVVEVERDGRDHNVKRVEVLEAALQEAHATIEKMAQGFGEQGAFVPRSLLEETRRREANVVGVLRGIADADSGGAGQAAAAFLRGYDKAANRRALSPQPQEPATEEER